MSRDRAVIFCAAAAVFLGAVPGAAWDRVGHRVAARIAWDQMAPETRQRAVELLLAAPRDADLAQLLPQDSRPVETRRRVLFEWAAYWPDIVRDRDFPERHEKYHRGNWHYYNYNWVQEPDGSAREIPQLAEQPENVWERLGALEKKLADPAADAGERAIALAWILHLGGDVHQPLHTSGRVTETEPEGDRGGNLFKLDGDDNLHWYWDRALSHKYRRWWWTSDDRQISKIARSIERRHPPPAPAASHGGGSERFEAWARESFEVVKAEVFPADLARGQKPARAYRDRVVEIAEARLARAGYRLAELIDQALAD